MISMMMAAKASLIVFGILVHEDIRRPDGPSDTNRPGRRGADRQCSSVLLPQRFVQTVLVDDLVVERCTDLLLARDHLDRVARQDAGRAQDEEDDGDPDERPGSSAGCGERCSSASFEARRTRDRKRTAGRPKAPCRSLRWSTCEASPRSALLQPLRSTPCRASPVPLGL